MAEEISSEQLEALIKMDAEPWRKYFTESGVTEAPPFTLEDGREARISIVDVGLEGSLGLSIAIDTNPQNPALPGLRVTNYILGAHPDHADNPASVGLTILTPTGPAEAITNLRLWQLQFTQLAFSLIRPHVPNLAT